MFCGGVGKIKGAEL